MPGLSSAAQQVSGLRVHTVFNGLWPAGQYVGGFLGHMDRLLLWLWCLLLSSDGSEGRWVPPGDGDGVWEEVGLALFSVLLSWALAATALMFICSEAPLPPGSTWHLLWDLISSQQPCKAGVTSSVLQTGD